MIEIPNLVPTLNPNRVISKKPNTLLETIINHNPGFFSEENVGLCRRTPINMIAVLLLRSLRNEIMEIFGDYETEKDINHNASFRQSVSVHSDVPIRLNANINRDGEVIIERAPFVLLKNYCGYQSAVVLTGELAGLILNPFPIEKTIYIGMVPNRLWNDSQAINIQLADEPDFFNGIKLGLEHEPQELKTISAYQIAKDLYEERLQQLSLQDKLVSEIFFNLCEQVLYQDLCSQMDYDNFYRTYPKNSL